MANYNRKPPGWWRHGTGKNRGGGRIQKGVRRAFAAADKPVLSSSEIYRWVYPNTTHPGWLQCWSVFQVLRATAHRVGRASTRGNPTLWKLRQPIRVAKVVANDTSPNTKQLK